MNSWLELRHDSIPLLLQGGNKKMIQQQENNSNQKLVPQASQALDQMKYEIAQEFGVNLGADTTSRANGSVGGEITKRLVQFAEQQLAGRIH
jgi:hypothetical protein